MTEPVEELRKENVEDEQSYVTLSTLTTSCSECSLESIGLFEAEEESYAIKLQISEKPEPPPSIIRKRRSTTKRSVSFDSVEVHEHSVILGFNPGLSSFARNGGPGPAMTIGWNSIASSIHSLDDFETQREKNRRAMFLLKRTKSERVNILKAEGFTSEELAEAEEVVSRIQKSRAESAQDRSELHAMMREAKKRQQAERQKRKEKGNIARRILRSFTTSKSNR